MQREDLALSPSEVRVRYEMRNDTGQPVTLRVAFPMPEVPRMTPGGMTTGPDDGNGPHNIALRPPTDPNFLNFRIRSNGQEIKPEVEIRATLPDGRDITGSLREIGGLPLVLQPGLFVEGDTPLPAESVTRLQALGAYEKLDDKAWRLPWTTRITRAPRPAKGGNVWGWFDRERASFTGSGSRSLGDRWGCTTWAA